jgi:hypothetical protein
MISTAFVFGVGAAHLIPPCISDRRNRDYLGILTDISYAFEIFRVHVFYGAWNKHTMTH